MYHELLDHPEVKTSVLRMSWFVECDSVGDAVLVHGVDVASSSCLRLSRSVVPAPSINEPTISSLLLW